MIDPRRDLVRMSRRDLVVEFAGLPGVGKTALSHAVAQRLRQRGIPVTELRSLYPDTSRAVRLRKMASALSGTLRRPSYAYRSALAVWASGQRSFVDAIKVLHNWLFVSGLMQGSSPGGRVLVFDQGIVQALWSIGYSARNGALAGVVDRLQTLLPRPDLVVIVEASPRIAARRLASRPFGGSRLEGPAAGDPRPFVRAVSRWEELKEIITQISVPAAPRISVVDNSSDGVDANAAWLAETIAQLYEGGRMARRWHGERSGTEMAR